ncbi:MAG: GNAT family N-acetyltransferase, partial [Thermoleophilaceae bacterium]
MHLEAALVPDRGALAVTNDFFRSRELYDAEGVSHTLGVGDAMVTPLVVREIDGELLRDAVSPYGYPGAAVRGPVAIDEVNWSTSGLVSIFLRDRIGAEPSLRGATLRSTVQIADPSKPLKLREQHRRHIRRNAREGY